jgi:hypothetical protein
VYFLVGRNGEVGHNFVGELNSAYWCQRMTTGTFELCTKRLVKLTPGVSISPTSYVIFFKKRRKLEEKPASKCLQNCL